MYAAGGGKSKNISQSVNPHRPVPHPPVTCCRALPNIVIFGTRSAVVDCRCSNGYGMNADAGMFRPGDPSGVDDDGTFGYFKVHIHVHGCCVATSFLSPASTHHTARYSYEDAPRTCSQSGQFGLWNLDRNAVNIYMCHIHTSLILCYTMSLLAMISQKLIKQSVRP